MAALTHADSVITWQENVTSEEMPPSWMWPFTEEINRWFDAVQAARDEKFGNNNGKSGDSHPPLHDNELVADWR